MPIQIVRSSRFVPSNINNVGDIIEEFNYYCALFFPSCKRSTKLFMFCDILKEYFRNGAWINNYFQYGFYGKNHVERADFVTWKKAVSLIYKANGRYTHPVFREKKQFNEYFAEFVKRDWIHMVNADETAFLEFITKHKTYIEKPNDSQLGTDIYKKSIDEKTNLQNLFKAYTGKSIILEENLVACEEFHKLHPCSLNTLRVTTILNKTGTKATVIAVALKMGMGESIVDNAGAGGLVAEVDLDMGTVLCKSANYKGETFDFHPDTNAKIKGLKIPVWESVLNMCKTAALRYKDAPLIGWDVAITGGDGDYTIQLIEGNENPSFPLLQVSSGKGLVAKINEAINI